MIEEELPKVQESPIQEENAQTKFHVDDEKLVVERVFDVEPVLKDISELKSISDGKSKTGEFYHVARVPAFVVEAYCNQNGITFSEFCANSEHARRLLMDADYKHLRVWEGSF